MATPNFLTISWIKDHLGNELFIALSLIALITSLFFLNMPLGWLGPILSFLALVIVSIIYFLGKKITLTSNKWFKEAISNLKTSNSAYIYLRGFRHPDYFKPDHRDNLIEIMKNFARLIVEHNQSIRIIAYSPSRNDHQKDPLSWLIDEIINNSHFTHQQATALVEQCIRVIHAEPTSNSSTFYLFDNQILLYNHIDNNKITYFKVDLNRSIIPNFLACGFKKQFETGEC